MSKAESGKQRGGFVLGMVVGLLLGLAIALGVALYITKVPIPFVNKVPQRTAEQDAEEAARNRNWDPNAPLAGKNGARSASGVLSPAPEATDANVPAAAVVTGASAAKPSDKAAEKPVDKAAEKSLDKLIDKANEKAADKSADKAADKPLDRIMEKVAESSGGKPGKAAASDGNLYFVQAGAFLKSDDAEQQRAKLAVMGFSAKVFEKEQSGRTVYRVRIGPLDTREEADSQKQKLEAAGIEANLAAVKR